MLDSFKEDQDRGGHGSDPDRHHRHGGGRLIGKYANTYQNKLLLVTAIRGYFMGLERDQADPNGYTVDIDVDGQEQYLVSKGVDTSEMTAQEIREADTGSHVFLVIAARSWTPSRTSTSRSTFKEAEQWIRES